MKTIVSMRFGSQLYGTATPQSDLDLKSVFIPPARDILLGKVKRTVSIRTKADSTAKNTAGDVDSEAYSLCKFITLLCEGQTVALDMLFATPVLDKVAGAAAPEWLVLWENRQRLFSRKADAFIGYAYQQASKYGVRGSRVAATKTATELLAGLIESHGPRAKLADCATEIEAFAAATEFCAIAAIPQPSGQKLKHLEVCNRKAPYSITLRDAHAIYARLFDQYGERARAAERNDGIDWKALSHAVRVGTESIEFLHTGFITFPRPDATHLLQIKRGDLPYAEVAAQIEALLERIRAAAAVSELPAEPDLAWCDDFVASMYWRETRWDFEPRHFFED